MSSLEMKSEVRVFLPKWSKGTRNLERKMVHVRCQGGGLQELLEGSEEAIQAGTQLNYVLLTSLDSVISI